MKVYKIELKRKLKEEIDSLNLNNSEKVYTYVCDKLIKPEDRWRENILALFTNSKNEYLSYMLLSSGGTNNSVIDIKVLAKTALESFADGVILVHNHPSNNPLPSVEDITQTDRVRKALACLDIKLMDHVIISDESFYSFATEKVYRANPKRNSK